MALANVYRLLAGADSCNPGTHAYGYCTSTTGLIIDMPHMLNKQTAGYICERLVAAADRADMIRISIDATGRITGPRVVVPIDHRLFLVVVAQSGDSVAFMGTPSRCLAAFLTAIYGGPMSSDTMWQRPITNFGTLPLQIAPLLTAVMHTVPAPTIMEQLVRLFDGHFRPSYIPPRNISAIDNPCTIYARKQDAGNLGAFAVLMFITKDILRAPCKFDRRYLLSEWCAINEYMDTGRLTVIRHEQWATLSELGIDDHGPLAEMVDGITKARVSAFDSVLKDIEIDNPVNQPAAVCRTLLHNLAEVLAANDGAVEAFEVQVDIPASLHNRVVETNRITWQAFLFGLLAEDNDIIRAMFMLDIYARYKDETRIVATEVGVQPFAFEATISRVVDTAGVVVTSRLDQNGRCICYIVGTPCNIEVFSFLCVMTQISKRSIPTQSVTPSAEHVLSTWWQMAVNSNESTCTNADILWRECLVPVTAQLDTDPRTLLQLKDCQPILAMALHTTHKIITTPASEVPFATLVNHARVVAYLWSLLFTTELPSKMLTLENRGARSVADLAENLRYKTVYDMLSLACGDLNALSPFHAILAPGAAYRPPWVIPRLNMKFGTLFVDSTGCTSSLRFWPGCEPNDLRGALAVFVQACMGAFEPDSCLAKESPSMERTATTWAHSNDDRRTAINLVETMVVDGTSTTARPGISGTLNYLLDCCVPSNNFVRRIAAIRFPRRD